MVHTGKHFLQIPVRRMCPTGYSRDGHSRHRSSRPDSRNWDSSFTGCKASSRPKTRRDLPLVRNRSLGSRIVIRYRRATRF